MQSISLHQAFLEHLTRSETDDESADLRLNALAKI